MVGKLASIALLALAAEQVAGADLIGLDPSLISEGTTLYLEHCSVCHGREADGKGPLASGFTPSPRDFTKGNFKFRSTKVGEAPTQADLTKTIKNGITGSYGQSMPAFDFFTDRELAALAEVIGLVAGIKEYATPVAPPPRPRRANIAKGKALFQELLCARCHGDKGDGQGVLAATLKDESGKSIRPADFRKGQFKGGNAPEDIWMRIYAGLDGTPMPAFGRNTSAADIWAVTEYVMTLSNKE